MNKIILFSLFLLVLLPVVSAEIQVGTSGGIGVDLNIPTPINYTLVNVNNSIYWDGNAWSNTRWLNIDGSNANTNIDIGIYNLTVNTLTTDGEISAGGELDMNNNRIHDISEITMNVGSWIRGFGSSGVRFGDDILSRSSCSYDIGNETHRFRNLYLCGNLTSTGNVTADYFFGSGAELTNLNVTGIMNVTGDFTGYAINVSFLYGALGIGGMDMRGDPWYLSGTNFQVADNITASYFIGDGSQLTNINHNSLAGLQGGGGEGSEYYHLSSVVHDSVMGFLATSNWHTNNLIIGNYINLTFADGNVTANNFFGNWNSSSDYVLNTGATSNVDLGSQNITASWFNGIFNWIIGSTSTNYLSFNGTQLDFDETQLNATIENIVDTAGAGLWEDEGTIINSTGHNIRVENITHGAIINSTLNQIYVENTEEEYVIWI